MVPASIDSQTWQQLCQQVSITNPALAALMKNSRARIVDEALVIEAPSQFLKDTIDKINSLQMIRASAGKAGLEGISEIRCEVMAASDSSVGAVAGVFDIM